MNHTFIQQVTKAEQGNIENRLTMAFSQEAGTLTIDAITDYKHDTVENDKVSITLDASAVARFGTALLEWYELATEDVEFGYFKAIFPSEVITEAQGDPEIAMKHSYIVVTNQIFGSRIDFTAGETNTEMDDLVSDTGIVSWRLTPEFVDELTKHIAEFLILHMVKGALIDE